jgi:hypothetical protein
MSLCVSHLKLKIVRTVSSSSSPITGNDYHYDDIMRNFEFRVPEKFNFAQDVIDLWATESSSALAFQHVMASTTATDTVIKWSYADLRSSIYPGGA